MHRFLFLLLLTGSPEARNRKNAAEKQEISGMYQEKMTVL